MIDFWAHYLLIAEPHQEEPHYLKAFVPLKGANIVMDTPTLEKFLGHKERAKRGRPTKSQLFL